MRDEDPGGARCHGCASFSCGIRAEELWGSLGGPLGGSVFRIARSGGLQASPSRSDTPW
ncbi:hypothetical protein SNL152K_3419 [Streptomyces sp. NL15-2K]|nr:hypothetical protein SNL152K_3419 [Streptomyces sp. NL15-2K]